MSSSDPQQLKSTFGSALWAQLQDVEVYLATGVEYNLALNDFFKGYAQAELEYAAQLLKVAKPFRDAIAKSKEKWQKSNDPSLAKQVTVNYTSTVMTAWERLLAQTESVAQLHFELSEVMNKERKDVKGNALQLQAHTKQNFEKVRMSETDLAKLMDIMERNQHSYEKELKNLDACGLHLKKCHKEKKEKEMDKSRMEFEKQMAAVNYSLFNYKKSVETCNTTKKKHYENTIPEILNEIQKQDEATRIDMSRATMVRIADTVASALPREAQMWADIADIARRIEGSHDSLLLISSFKTNDRPPVDFNYLDTHDDFKKKQLLCTENQFKVVDGEDLASTPPKVGKKKATERLKSIEKEIVELEKKRSGLLSILTVLADLPHTEGTSAEVTIHKNDIELKLNSLALKRQGFLEYVAEADGKPMPPPVTLFLTTSENHLANSSGKITSFVSLKSPITNSPPMDNPDAANSHSRSSTTAASPTAKSIPQNPSSLATNNAELKPLHVSISQLSFSDDAKVSPGQGSQNWQPELGSPLRDANLFGTYGLDKMTNAAKGSLPKVENAAETPSTVVKPKIETPPNAAKLAMPLIDSTRLEAQKAVEFLLMASMDSDSILGAVEEPLEKVEVLYDFDAAEGTAELSVKAGTMLEILQDDAGDGWSRCRLFDDHNVAGLVPKAYIGKS